LTSAAAMRQVPLQVLDVKTGTEVPAAYRHKLVLCRADQHVAWRGDEVPRDAAGLVDLLRGAGT
jgi:hypothetical protein